MNSDQQKDLVRRFIDEVLVRGDRAAVDALVTDDFLPHDWPPSDRGRDGLKGAIERVAAGLSDVRMTIDDILTEDDRVAVRLTAEARQSGPFMGLEPTGRRYSIQEIHWFRVQDGRIAEHWYQANLLGLMRQLGALPDRSPQPTPDR